jgi:hypothetical protein
MTKKEDQDRHDQLVKAFLGGLSAEEVERQRRREYRHGYPKATEAEIQLLMDADDKAGYPPQGLGHARYIMRTSAGARLPAPTAKDFDDAARVAMKVHRDHLAHLALVSTMKFVDWDHRPTVLDGDRAFAVLRPGAPWVAVDRWDVGQTGSDLSEDAWRKTFFGKFGTLDLSKIPKAADQKPTRHELPGVMALVLSRTLQQVAKDIGDGQMMLYATDIERRARGVIGMHASLRHSDDTAN